jgi:pSer/pThr/pTyr-binding forkhead associated (FHA) protein
VSVTLVVTAASSSPNDRNAGAAQRLVFDQPRIVIGRGAHADVRVPSRAVSDTHAIVRFESGDLSVVDEASTNGTTVNGQPLVKGRKKALRSGDRIGIPGFEITVETSLAAADPPGHTMTVARRLLAGALAASGGEAAPPELVLTTGRRAGRRWTLGTIGDRAVAGRGDDCTIMLDDPDCSRAHAEFERDELGVIVRDLQSKNGVFVGARPVQERRLRHGDEVQMGRSVLAYSDPGEELLRAFEGGADEPPSAPIPAPPFPPPSAVASQPEPSPSLTPPERNAATIPPPPGSSGDAAASATVESAASPGVDAAQIERPSKAIQPRKKSGSAADWIVVALAIVILGVSAAALYVLLRGTPAPH